MKKGLELTFVVGGAIALLVLVVSIILVYTSTGDKSGYVSDATRFCDLACLEDSRKNFHDDGGICRLDNQEENFTFLTKEFKIGDEIVDCTDLSSCRIKDASGRYCELLHLDVE